MSPPSPPPSRWGFEVKDEGVTVAQRAWLKRLSAAEVKSSGESASRSSTSATANGDAATARCAAKCDRQRATEDWVTGGSAPAATSSARTC